MNEWMESLPPRLLQELAFAVGSEPVQEIHLRAGRKTEVQTAAGSMLLSYRAGQEDLQMVLESAMERSYYAAREYLREGFCTTRNGCRIGIAGTVVRDEKGIRTIREISSLNLRVARSYRGVAGQALETLRRKPASMLILGKPGCGKTTLLRDLVRLISDDLKQRVAVADTRYELGAAVDGEPTLEIGQRTDLLSGGSREESVLMLLRTMNPRWIAVDEITAAEDVRAMERCFGCGVNLLATAHAWSREDLRRRPIYRAMVEAGMFHHLVELEAPGVYRIGTLEAADG